MKARDATNGAWMISYGQNAPEKSGIGQGSIATIEYYSEREWFWNMKPVWAAGTDAKGGTFLSLGMRKDFYWNQFQISPYFGPALHQSNFGSFDAGELLQFRTGIDLMLPLDKDLLISNGYYHMSNSLQNDGSASVDVTRISIVRRF